MQEKGKTKIYKNKHYWTSGQDGGIGEHVLPPCTTKQKVQLDYKTNVTQNNQKIMLYGSLTTKELKKPHSSKQVEGWRWTERHRNIDKWNGRSHTLVCLMKIDRDTL